MKIDNEQSMRQFGELIGRLVSGGEVLELIGDVGAGKTTLTKGIGLGMAINEPIQSPTFTISRTYKSPRGLTLMHYDFYRLQEAGIMGDEIREVAADPTAVVVVEWAGAVDNDLPEDRLRIFINATAENQRVVKLVAGGDRSAAFLAKIEEQIV